MVHAGWQEADVLQRSFGGCRTKALQGRPDHSVLMSVSRMRTHGEKFLSGVEKAATPPSLAFLQTFRAPTGSLGSPSWPRTASSCLRVRRNWARKTGWLRFRLLSTDPCCLRSTQVNQSFIYLFTPKHFWIGIIFFPHSLCSGGVFQTQTMTVQNRQEQWREGWHLEPSLS